MSHYYGEVRVNNKTVHEIGYKSLGLKLFGACPAGAIAVSVFYDKKSGLDMVRVRLTPWQGQGNRRLLYKGTIDGRPIEALKHDVAWKLNPYRNKWRVEKLKKLKRRKKRIIAKVK